MYFWRFWRFWRFVESITYVFSKWPVGSIPPAGTRFNRSDPDTWITGYIGNTFGPNGLVRPGHMGYRCADNPANNPRLQFWRVSPPIFPPALKTNPATHVVGAFFEYACVALSDSRFKKYDVLSIRLNRRIKLKSRPAESGDFALL